MKKLDITTPPGQLKKSKNRWLIVSVFLGLCSLGGCSSGDIGGGFLCLAVAVLPFLRFLKISRLFSDQKNAAAQAAADAQKRVADRAREAEERTKADMEEWQQFLEENELVKQLHTKVAGVTFNNEDGTRRQELLENVTPGTPVNLKFFTYKGEPAYAVYYLGDQIGNIPATLAKEIYDYPDDYTVTAEVANVTGGYDGLNYGCNLLVDLYRKKQSVGVTSSD